MAVTLANSCAISVSTNDSAYNAVGHAEMPDFSPPQKEKVDTSACGEPAGSAIAGLTKFEGSCSAFYDPSDTGQSAVLSAAAGTGLLYVKILPAGSGAGWKASCFISDVKISGGARDAQKLSFSFSAVAAPSAVS